MKIGELRYRQVQGARGLSPNAAANKFQNKARFIDDVTGSVSKLAQQIGDVQYESQANDANTNARMRVNEYKKTFGSGEPVSMAQLDAQGIGEDVRQHPDYREGMETIPSHMFYTRGLEEVIKRTVEEEGQKISNLRARNAWQANAREAGDAQVMASYADSEKNRVKYNFERIDTQRKAAEERGDFQAARDFLQNPVYNVLPTETRQLMNDQIDVAEEMATFDDMFIEAESRPPEQHYDAYTDIMDTLIDTDRETKLSSEEIRKLYFSAAQQRSGGQAAIDAQKTANEDFAFKETMAQVISGDMALTDVVANRGSYSRSGFNTLVNFADSWQNDPGKTGVVIDAMENQLLVEIQMGALGSWDEDLYPDYESFQRSLYGRIANMATQTDSDGNLIEGLSPPRLRALFAEVEALPAKAYDNDQIKYINKQLNLRILRSEQPGLSMLSTDQSAAMMADALRDLRTYITENGGSKADLGYWQENRMPMFFNASSKAAFFNLPSSLKSYAVYSGGDGGNFQVDVEASRAAMQSRITTMTNEGRSTTTLVKNLAKFNQWVTEHGEGAVK